MRSMNDRAGRATAKRLATATACAALAAVAVTGATGPGLGASPAQAPRNQVFSIISLTVHGKERPIPVVGSGAITAAGVFTEKAIARDLDRITLRFPKGTLVLRARENLSWKPDLGACLATARGGTTWKVIGGTGAYAGATGGGTYTDHGTLLGARGADGACLGKAAPPPYVIVTADFVGTVTLPDR